MSQWRGRIEEIEEPGDVLELVGQYYQIPSVLALLIFMVWTRVRSWDRFVVDGTVVFGGNDPWYHYRMVSYTVRNWPETMPFDPWTYFPYGTNSSQFGTVLDQFVATIALVVGLGSPSDHTVRMVALFAPVLIGVATVVPVYVMGRRTSNDFAGVVAVAVLALAPSAFMSRSTVGFFDHHVAEAFLMSLAILATMVAASVAEQEKPVWELFEARDARALRRPVGWALVAGVTVALYVWTWPPGVFLIGIIGVFYMIQLASEYAHGESPEHLAIVGTVSLGTAGVLILAALEAITFSSTTMSLLQPGAAFLVAGGCAFMAWLAREWDARDLSNLQYPAAVAGILVVGAALASVLVPDLFWYMIDQILRVIGLDATPTARTVGEAQPMDFDGLYDNYKFTVYVALVGVSFVFGRHFVDKPRAELTLLAVWFVFLLLATMTQQRFDYYLAVAVAVMTAMVVGQLIEFADLFEFDGDVDTYQWLTIVAIVLVVFAPIVYPMAANDEANPESGVMYMSNTGPGQSVQAWDENLEWFQDHSPEEGDFAGAGNDMPYYGTFDRTDDFEYDEGFYGVLSWWDYGHFITAMSERIPNANPFQQGASEAANFLLSGDEERANEIADEMSDGENAETRYVMVDWQMVSAENFYLTGDSTLRLGAKYTAPFQFYDDGEISETDHFERLWYEDQFGYQPFYRYKQDYFESTAVRLYKFHGSAVEAKPVVLDWDVERTDGGRIRQSNGSLEFDSMEDAREYVDGDTTSQIGGFGQFPEQRVEAMEHYRLVGTSEQSAAQSQQYRLGTRKHARGMMRQGTELSPNGVLGMSAWQSLHKTPPSWVKTFERVPGATIEGEGPANVTISAAVEMEMPWTNSTFTYHQRAQTDDDGQFSMTVPYSSTGYDEWGTEDGRSNTSVRATGPYEVDTVPNERDNGTEYTYNDTVHVTEGQVIGENESASTVTLTRSEVNESDDTEPESGADAPGDDADAVPDDGAGDGTDDESNDTNSQSVDPQSAGIDAATAVSVAGLGAVGVVAATRRRR